MSVPDADLVVPAGPRARQTGSSWLARRGTGLALRVVVLGPLLFLAAL